MTPGAQAQGALEVLEAWDGGRTSLSRAHSEWRRRRRFAGSSDADAVASIASDALRLGVSSAWRLDDDSPRAMILGAIRRLVDSPDALRRMLSVPHALAPPSEAETRRLFADDDDDAPPHVRAETPDDAFVELSRSLGEDAVDEGRAASRRPPIAARANALKGGREATLKALRGLGARPAPYAPYGVLVSPPDALERRPRLRHESGYLRGRFEIQDEGSQLIAHLCEATAGMQALDLCAGSGGKTLALAADMQNRGQIYACDADRARLAPIYERLRRAGVRNAQVRAPATKKARPRRDLSARSDALSDASSDSLADSLADSPSDSPADSPPDPIAPVRDLEGALDCVLLDVPCSGSGAWRRRPEGKWRFRRERLADLAARQDDLLNAAATLPKVGATLCYATCSLFAEENERRIEAFLSRHANYRPDPPTSALNRLLPAREDASAPYRLVGDLGALLTPARTGSDGFFFSRLRRVA